MSEPKKQLKASTLGSQILMANIDSVQRLQIAALGGATINEPAPTVGEAG